MSTLAGLASPAAGAVTEAQEIPLFTHPLTGVAAPGAPSDITSAVVDLLRSAVPGAVVQIAMFRWKDDAPPVPVGGRPTDEEAIACTSYPEPQSFDDITSGVHGELFPRPGAETGDPILAELAATACPSEVDVAMNSWSTDTRGEAILGQLTALSQAGCVVRVVTQRDETIKPELVTALGVAAHCSDSAPDDDVGPADIALAVHSKYILVNGTYAGADNSRIVFTGSETFDAGARDVNDNTWLSTADPDVYPEYAANFDEMWANTPPCSAAPNSP